MSIQILLLTIILIIIALLGLSVRLFFSKNAEFRGGSCANITPELRDQGISCACGGVDDCVNDKEEIEEKD